MIACTHFFPRSRFSREMKVTNDSLICKKGMLKLELPAKMISINLQSNQSHIAHLKAQFGILSFPFLMSLLLCFGQGAYATWHLGRTIPTSVHKGERNFFEGKPKGHF